MSFRSLRGTTMSTMPCSRRYSAVWKPSGSFSRIVCSMTRWPAKPIDRARLGNVDVAQHGVGGRDAAGGRVGQHDDVGQAGLLQHARPQPWCAAAASATGCLPACGRRPRRRTARRGSLSLDGNVHRLDDHLAGSHAERAAHEANVMDDGDHFDAAALAAAREHRIFHAGLAAMFLEPVGIALLVAEFQRIGATFGGSIRLVLAIVEEIAQPLLRGDLMW